MSQFAPTVAFIPLDVSDTGLAELRRIALSAMQAAPKFSQWLHTWCDVEQAKRPSGDMTRTYRHITGVPAMVPWTDAEVGEAIEAVNCMAHAIADFTASTFIERVALTVAMEAGRRLRGIEDPKTEVDPNASPASGD